MNLPYLSPKIHNLNYVLIFQASSFASKYFSEKSESIFSNILRQNSVWDYSPEGSSLSNDNLTPSMIYNTIDRYLSLKWSDKVYFNLYSILAQ